MIFSQFFHKGERMKYLLSMSVLSILSFGMAQDWVCPEGFEGQELTVYNWTTYIAEDTIPKFEEACGVSVTYDTFPTDSDMLARLRQGNPGYDIVVPSEITLSLMIEEGLVEEIDKSNVPNFANLDETFINLPFDPENTYSAPYQWGTVGIGYNTQNVPDGVSSWEDVWNHDGAVSWLEDVRPMLGVALVKLGYDPNTDDTNEITEARDYLVENGNNVTYINQDDGQEVLLRGEADIVVEYSGDIFQIIDECDCDTYAYVIPEDAANFWVDNLAIPSGAPNKALAEAFIDYVLDAQIGADISNYTAYGSPNAAAIEAGLIDADLLADPGIYPSEETQANLFFIESTGERNQLYQDAWDELRILIGN